MILSNIGEEIMNGDPQNIVTYANYGTLLNRTGNFAVPSFNMNEYKEYYQNYGFLQSQKNIRQIDLNNTRNSHWMYVY